MQVVAKQALVADASVGHVLRTRGPAGRPDDSCPPGCTLRRYEKPGASPFWEGKLPKGILHVHSDGKQSNSKTMRFGPLLRSEDSAKQEILSFLWSAVAAGLIAGPGD